jgi:CheY-like chemotaxis protein
MITKTPKDSLLADDSEFFRTKLSDILIEAGHKVTFASDGREVINKVHSSSSTFRCPM